MKTVNHNNYPSLRLVVDCVSLSVTSIDLAIEMAATVKTPLQVIFIEDEDLVRIAGLPFASEICRSTAQQNPTDENRMQRSLRSRASQFRKSLQESAQAYGVAWSFESISGKATDVGLQTELEITYTIIGQPVSYRSLSKSHRRPRRILVAGNQLARVKPALQAVLQSFSTEKIEIILLQTEQSGQPSILEFLQKTHASEKRISIVEARAEQSGLILSATDTAFDCAILSRQNSEDIQRQLINNLHCPVILVA